MMINWLGILVVVGLIGGIIFLAGGAPEKQKSREDFLKELAEFLEGKFCAIAGKEDSYRVDFEFEGIPFYFEDVEQKGFRGKAYKTYLKVKTKSELTLYFTEKENAAVKMTMVMASEIPNEPIQVQQKVNLPSSLNTFKAFTNNAFRANQLLENKKIEQIFLEFKNLHKRGSPFLSISIVNGIVILEFHTIATFKPNMIALRNNPSLIDHYVERLGLVVQELNKK